MPSIRGNEKSVFAIMGARTYARDERQLHDFYATPPIAVDALVSAAGQQISHRLWEPACGIGHLSERLKHYGYNVYSTDMYDRGYGDDFFDFLTSDRKWDGDIITNPPYKYALEFVKHALSLIDEGRRVYLFLKLSFLESKLRRPFFDTLQLETVYVFSDRMTCAKNGDFKTAERGAVSYAWFVFRKGYGSYPEIRWL